MVGTLQVGTARYSPLEPPRPDVLERPLGYSLSLNPSLLWEASHSAHDELGSQLGYRVQNLTVVGHGAHTWRMRRCADGYEPKRRHAEPGSLVGRLDKYRELFQKGVMTGKEPAGEDR